MEKRTAMNKELKAQYDAIRNECGHESNFRIIIGYIMDKGFSCVGNITEAEIKDMVAQLKEDEKKLKGVPFMTPEYQGWIAEMAVKLVKVSSWIDFLKYITNEVFIG